MTLLSNSGHDENWGIAGGKAGDQGGEWSVIDWYDRPWYCVLRHPDVLVRSNISRLAKESANNDNIGYDQNERNTFWNQLVKSNFNPSKIKVPCEADCSAGVIAITKAVGYLTGRKELQSIPATYTGNMRNAYSSAGFKVLSSKQYLNSGDYLIEGDILLNDDYHTAIAISNGSKVNLGKHITSSKAKVMASEPAMVFDRSIAGNYKVIIDIDFLNLRNGAGTEPNEYGSDKDVLVELPPGSIVQNYGYYSNVNGIKWLWVQSCVNGITYTGFCSSEYLTRTEENRYD